MFASLGFLVRLFCFSLDAYIALHPSEVSYCFIIKTTHNLLQSRNQNITNDLYDLLVSVSFVCFECAILVLHK